MIYLMQGVPGSGKSSWIKYHMAQMSGDTVICSADHYHVGADGVYRFDPTKAAEAHARCFADYLRVVSDSRINVYVDNTNTAVWELAPYYRVGEVVRGPNEIKIVRISCPFEIAAGRNTHNVPGGKLLVMYQQLLTERLPVHWNIELLCNDKLMDVEALLNQK